MATAFFGHMGIEWNLLREPDEAIKKLGTWVAEFKRHRADFATGTVVHADGTDPSVRLDGMVSADRARAVYRFTQVTSSQTYPAAPVRLPGLDPEATYRVRPMDVSLDLETPGIGCGQSDLYWWNDKGVELSGGTLSAYGIRPPAINVAQAVLFEAARV